jgi:hypothetical protein
VRVKKNSNYTLQSIATHPSLDPPNLSQKFYLIPTIVYILLQISKHLQSLAFRNGGNKLETLSSALIIILGFMKELPVARMKLQYITHYTVYPQIAISSDVSLRYHYPYNAVSPSASKCCVHRQRMERCIV